MKKSERKRETIGVQAVFGVRPRISLVRLRQMLASHSELASKLAALERKYDEQFAVVFEAIRQLMAPPATPRRQIGFKAKEARAAYRGSRKGQKN
jgi:DnaJ-domain-containing protein 1